MSEKIALLEQRIDDLERELAAAQLWKKAPNRHCLSQKEVAEQLGCSVKKVQQYEQQGLLVAMYPNAKKRYHYKDVETFMRGHKPRKKSHGNIRSQK